MHQQNQRVCLRASLNRDKVSFQVDAVVCLQSAESLCVMSEGCNEPVPGVLWLTGAVLNPLATESLRNEPQA